MVPQPAAPLCHPVFIELLKLNGDFLLPKATRIAHTLFPAVSEYSSRPPPFPHHHQNRTDLIGQTVFLPQSHIIRCPEPGSFRGPALQSFYRARPVLAKWQIGSHFAVWSLHFIACSVSLMISVSRTSTVKWRSLIPWCRIVLREGSFQLLFRIWMEEAVKEEKSVSKVLTKCFRDFPRLISLP